MGKVLKSVLRGFTFGGGVFPPSTKLPDIRVKTLSDTDAIRSDWQRVGDAIRQAATSYEQSQQNSKTQRQVS